MNKFILCASVCFGLFFAACGDDSSSITEPSDESSSSVVKSSSSTKNQKSSSSSYAKSSSSKKTSSSSKKIEQSSSSVILGFSSVTLSEVEGSLTDTRDGQSYKTVVIGSQTWMAQNLNFETENSYCTEDDPSNCTKYGRLYTWAVAMDSAGTWSVNGKGCGYGKTCSPTYPVRGVCPTGWHLPTQTEWNTLFAAVGGSNTAGTKLKSTTGWNSSGNGTDAYSFSALPAGYRSNFGNYSFEGINADFWSSTEGNSYYAFIVFLRYDGGSANLVYHDKYYGFSVRCVKDE
ncbi:fibrobacter succinogenes major paralogous domain-containing protein [Fibrobacter sp.]|uniref:fibrobacter succinogenes major paralogous domain-containing protein n=1 Tax=Fibrobacter sp. TaxID=35828 RepID=UPI0025BAA0EB|nr:fibrobacter succinogenes major paralogous domain-containing protein [Fibrobacter sp.]MBR3072528.1 fibrobacter succinogenes major paralogous domain-containing protein [Fibrobacter sp.]